MPSQNTSLSITTTAECKGPKVVIHVLLVLNLLPLGLVSTTRLLCRSIIYHHSKGNKTVKVTSIAFFFLNLIYIFYKIQHTEYKFYKWCWGNDFLRSLSNIFLIKMHTVETILQLKDLKYFTHSNSIIKCNNSSYHLTILQNWQHQPSFIEKLGDPHQRMAPRFYRSVQCLSPFTRLLPITSSASSSTQWLQAPFCNFLFLLLSSLLYYYFAMIVKIQAKIAALTKFLSFFNNFHTGLLFLEFSAYSYIFSYAQQYKVPQKLGIHWWAILYHLQKS